MPTSLIVVDDFLGTRDAHALRAAALALPHPDLEGAFPGRNSLERIEIEGLDAAVSHRPEDGRLVYLMFFGAA